MKAQKQTKEGRFTHSQKSRLLQSVNSVSLVGLFQIPHAKQSCPLSTKSKQARSYSVRRTQNHKYTTLCGLNSWCVFWLAPVGQYLPSCDEEGYYRTHQCHSSSGQCWCVDRYGNEVAGSRTHGPADCGRQDIQACQVCVFKKMRDTQHDGKN